MSSWTRWLMIGVAGTSLLAVGVLIGRSSAADREATGTSRREIARTVPVPERTATGQVHPVARVASLPVLSRGSPMALSASIQADLVHPDARIRRATLRELSSQRASVDPSIFVAASRDADLVVGAAATEILGKLYADGAIPLTELISLASDGAVHEKVRVAALNGLGVLPSKDAEAFLREILSRGDAAGRRSAAILLVHQDPFFAVPSLIDALTDSDSTVRANALESLRRLSRGRDFRKDVAAWRAWWQATR